MADANWCGDALRTGQYGSILLSTSPVADQLIEAFASHLVLASSSEPQNKEPVPEISQLDQAETFAVALAAFNAFLQANVTGPVLPEADALDARFTKAYNSAQGDGSQATIEDLRKTCLRYLEVDGVSPYAYIPHLELFALAKFIISEKMNVADQKTVEIPSSESLNTFSTQWTWLRVHVWHYKLLTQPSLGPGSNFTRSSQWSDVPSLASTILDGIDAVQKEVFGDEIWAEDDSWSRNGKVQFLLEASNNYILLGRDDKAKEALKEATQVSGLAYALSGALGKRTRFQEKSTSQLVVLAKSGADSAGPAEQDEETRPDALQLNDDTLLEEIQFNADRDNNDSAKITTLPPALADLAADDQPQLSPLDQIILLTEATLKDAFSPLDTLTSEEVLPFAVRVISDKSTNWQIYTHALLVRSRIEVHRSRTVERGVLQLQAVADQVLTDTTAEAQQGETQPQQEDAKDETPTIQVSAPDQAAAPAASRSVPTSFLPAPKASESAPAQVRLQYIHALSSPPRWHLEAELAYAWTGVGSLTSALEIFKRLRLWAEVALCLASSAAADDEDGRGSGGEAKAKGIVRWRLFGPSGDCPDKNEDTIGEDIMHLKPADFAGPERVPPPPNAPRLFCILGDLENDPQHYERAWEISKHRYARAQRSLGEYYLQQKDWEKAQEAYKKATVVNRLSPDMWSRLGDINLRLARFEDAAEAFSRSIGCASDTAGGEDARTWSNLGSALWSLYLEVCEEEKNKAQPSEEPAEDEEVDDSPEDRPSKRDPATLLAQSLAAYKKGASIAHDSWQIWENVLTLASRIRPAAIPEMVLALKHIIRIRHSEDELDDDIISAMLQKSVLCKEKEPGTGVYEPPRGSPERLITRLIEEDVVPLITKRSELWVIVSRLRAWRRDYAGCIEAAEAGWRAAVGTASRGLLPGAARAEDDWTIDAGAFDIVIERTDELVSALENWGPEVETIGPRWKSKGRMAVKSVMRKARENWYGLSGWRHLETLMEGLKE